MVTLEEAYRRCYANGETRLAKAILEVIVFLSDRGLYETDDLRRAFTRLADQHYNEKRPT